MGVKMKGLAAAKRNMDRILVDEVGKKALRAAQIAMQIGATRAAFYTPIDTSFLINSQYREVMVSKTRVTGRVGYSAAYAVYVHDPTITQEFRRASAEKEFLKKGFEEEQETIFAAIAKEMSL